MAKRKIDTDAGFIEIELKPVPRTSGNLLVNVCRCSTCRKLKIKDFWTVTHGPTGRSLRDHLPTEETAVRYAKELWRDVKFPGRCLLSQTDLASVRGIATYDGWKKFVSRED